MSFLFTLFLFQLVHPTENRKHGSDSEPIYSYPGKWHDLPQKGNLIIDEHLILQGKPYKNFWRIKSKSKGKAFLKNGPQIVEFHVLNKKDYLYLQDLKNTLDGKIGLNIMLQQDCPVLTGKLLSVNDYIDIHQKMKNKTNSCKNNFLTNWNLNPDIEQELKSYLLKTFSLLNIQDSQIILTPSMKIDLPEKSHPLVENSGIQIMKNSKFSKKWNIRSKIFIVEIKRNASSKLGIDWPTTVQANLTSASKIQIEDLTAQLHFLETQGEAKILATPQLLSLDEQEAEFFAGGEIPYTHQTSKYKKTNWKSYGILLKVRGVYQSTGRLEYNLSVEISMPDFTVQNAEAPGFSKNKVQSKFQMQDKDTLILSGLIKEDQGRSQSGVKTLSQIPFIGALFRSEDYIHHQSELFILIQPEVIYEP